MITDCTVVEMLASVVGDRDKKITRVIGYTPRQWRMRRGLLSVLQWVAGIRVKAWLKWQRLLLSPRGNTVWAGSWRGTDLPHRETGRRAFWTEATALAAGQSHSGFMACPLILGWDVSQALIPNRLLFHISVFHLYLILINLCSFSGFENNFCRPIAN